jgi:hypothetical protein
LGSISRVAFLYATVEVKIKKKEEEKKERMKQPR